MASLGAQRERKLRPQFSPPSTPCLHFPSFAPHHYLACTTFVLGRAGSKLVWPTWNLQSDHRLWYNTMQKGSQLTLHYPVSQLFLMHLNLCSTEIHGESSYVTSPSCVSNVRPAFSLETNLYAFSDSDHSDFYDQFKSKIDHFKKSNWLKNWQKRSKYSMIEDRSFIEKIKIKVFGATFEE